MGSTCIDSILCNLKLLETSLDGEDNEMGMLKLDLRFLRTFLLCSRKNHRELFSECGHNTNVSLGSSLLRIENAVGEMKRRSEDATRRMKQKSEAAEPTMEQRSEEGFKSSDLKKVVYDFRETIGSFKEEVKRAYVCFSECSMQCVSPLRDELLEIIESLLENVSDLKWSKPYDQALFMVRDHDKILGEFIELLDGKLTFFRSFIRYVTSRGVEHVQLEDLLTQFEVMVVNAARATYMSWFDRFDKLILIFVQLGEIRPDDPRVKDDNKLIPELLEKMKPDDLKFQEIYVQVLTAIKSPESSDTIPQDILVDYVDSLQAQHFGLLNYGDHFVISVYEKMQIVYGGLRFLINVFKNRQKRYGDLAGNVKGLIEVVVNDAGILICSLLVNKMKEVLDEEMDLALSNLLEKIKLVKAEIEHVKTEALEIDHSKDHTKAEKAAEISSDVLPQRSNPTINEFLVILHDEVDKVSEQLTRGPKHLKAVTIVGMPGLGKTTLAKRVFNDPSIVYHFHIRAWCCVSQIYCKKDLFSEILGYIVPESSDQCSTMDEDDLAQKLYRCLKGKIYLIVLDDTWNIEAWNTLLHLFPNDTNGSRILLTSRVVLQIKPHGHLHLLRQLTDDESWELLQRKLFPKKAFPQKLMHIGMQVAKNCSELPLSVVIVAGILATTDHDSWGKIAERLRSDMVFGTELHVMNILELSYRHLSDSLKKCFLYFGAFPEDREIPLWKLKCLWIAEGFVGYNDSRILEDLAENYIMDLVDRSLVMVGKTSSIAGVKTCRIHDLLHEFCVVKAKEESFMQRVRGSDELFTFNESGSTHRLCIHSKVKDFQMSRLFCPGIHSLMFFPHGYVPQVCNFSFVFRICKLLRILDLEQIAIGNTFPTEIELLIELRYLAIHGDIQSIPLSIANLLNLETFYAKVFSGEALLPATIWNMCKLRHLVGVGVHDSSLVEHNLEISPSLDYLSTLYTLTVSIGPALDKILKKIPNVRKLKCRILESGNSTEDHQERIVAMDFLLRLESLKLFLGLNHVEFLFPHNLKKLSLDHFSWSIVSTIGKLPNLEVLKLHNAYGEVTWDMEEGEFPKLKILNLGYLNMVSWAGSGDDFPCLRKLVLDRIWNLCELPSCFGDSSALETIEVRWCHQPSVASLVREIEQSQKTTGNEDFKMIILGGN